MQEDMEQRAAERISVEPSFLNRILIIVLTVIGLVGFWWLRSVWILIFASAVIAVGISVPARWLEQHGLSRGLSIAIAAISAVGGAIAVMLLFVLPISAEMGRAFELAPAAVDSAAQIYDDVRANLPILRNILPERESSAILTQLGELASNVDFTTVQDALTTVFQAGSTVLPSLIKGMGTFLTILTNVLFVVAIAIFFLIEPMSYIKASLYVIPEQHHERALRVWSELYQALSKWIVTQFLAISITVVLVWVVLGLILNVPSALTISLIAGFATFIPNIGVILPLIPLVFFILVSDEPNQSTLLLQAVPAYLILQAAEGSILTPRLMNAQLSIPSGALLLFQVVAASVFGAVGLIFAVPMLATLVTLIREIFSYELLGLRGKSIDVVSISADGTLALRQQPRDGFPADDGQAGDSGTVAESTSPISSLGNSLQGMFGEFRNVNLRSRLQQWMPTRRDPDEGVVIEQHDSLDERAANGDIGQEPNDLHGAVEIVQDEIAEGTVKST